ELKEPYGVKPVILLTDDAENPTVVEKIVSDAYFDHPAARVQYHGATMRPTGWRVLGWSLFGNLTDPRDDVPWLRPEKGKNLLYRGINLRITPREVWSHDSAVAEELQKVQELSAISLSKRIGRHPEYNHNKKIVRPLTLVDRMWNYDPDELLLDGLTLLYPLKNPNQPIDPKRRVPIPDEEDEIFYRKKATLSIRGKPTSFGLLDFSTGYYPEKQELFTSRSESLAITSSTLSTSGVADAGIKF
ncbi:MAG: hypothetical protein OQK07_07025, partial [Rhodospirillales bacterium]|nr:hypothetical protein [Rhodospirillales bacterium]